MCLLYFDQNPTDVANLINGVLRAGEVGHTLA
jgi:hypothetical protein